MGFGVRPAAGKDMIVPVMAFVMDASGHVYEDRTEHYIVALFADYVEETVRVEALLAEWRAVVRKLADAGKRAFAGAAIFGWWLDRGRAQYPQATTLSIVADGGGSNGYRVRRWKAERQRLATDTGLAIHVRHLRPGTSKWDTIGHRLFSLNGRSGRGRPLTTFETLVQCIAHTTTPTGLTVHAEWDPAPYPAGLVVSDEDFKAHRERDAFHGEWNYSIRPAS